MLGSICIKIHTPELREICLVVVGRRSNREGVRDRELLIRNSLRFYYRYTSTKVHFTITFICEYEADFVVKDHHNNNNIKTMIRATDDIQTRGFAYFAVAIPNNFIYL